MNLRELVLGVNMVVVCYLVISIPMVIATNVNIIYDGLNVGSVEYNPGDYVRVNAAARDGGVPKIGRDQDWRIDFVVENNTNGVIIESGYVYKCGDLAPDVCVDTVSPEAFSVKFDKTYNWIDIRDKDSPTHNESSNFVVFVRVVKSGRTFWTGFHYQVRRITLTGFYGISDDLPEIEVHASHSSSINSILSFIQSSFIIPFNPSWVEKVVFQGADYVFEIRSDNPPYFETDVNEADDVSSLGYDYGFVFSNDSSGTYNAVVLNDNPSYTCGSDGCETGLGENSVNCCLDCSCLSGYYCDAVESCRNENSITLSLSGTQTTYVSNCYDTHQIDVNVMINNAPSDMVILSSDYSIAGSSQSTACSQLHGDVYSCHIDIPPVPGCSENTPDFGPNSITLDISYSDGGVQKNKVMSTSFPDITIGSFECGDYLCQAEFLESSDNCCFDCGCGSGYCDIGGLSRPESGSCKVEFDESDVRITLDRANFGSYNSGGETVGLDLKIVNAPSSLDVSGEACSMGCVGGNVGSCSASCSLSCSVGSSGGGVYEERCSMGFTIADYDNNFDYTLTPVIDASAGYYDGSDYVVGALSKASGAVNIRANFCGDGVCA
ncbi:MAG: hypothetical protein ACXABY_15370, partial [Candidatus Thorarchaeota archaeon]